MNVLARCKDGRIFVQTGYEDKDICKSIAGGKWEPGVRQWTYPYSPQSARNIFAAFGKRLLVDKQFAELLKKSQEVDEMKQNQNTLEAIPIFNPQYPPWKHQLLAYHITKTQPATMLPLKMGHGKTKVVIDVIQNSPEERKILVVCPHSVVRVWGGEFKKHYILGTTFILDRDIVLPNNKDDVLILPLDTGGVKNKLNQLKSAEQTAAAAGCRLVTVINYESAWREPMRSYLMKSMYDIVIADEIHRIKAPGGKASKFMQLLGNFIPKRVGLTGTPMPNTPLDIYAQYRFLDTSIFGSSFARFREQYAFMGGYGGYQVLSYKNQDELKRKFYSIAMNVDDNVIQLPPVVEEERYCELSHKAQKTYDELENSLIADIGNGTVTAQNGLTLLLRLQQLTGGWLTPDLDLMNQQLHREPEQIDESKMKLLADVLEDIDINDPVVVFCRFVQDLATVRAVAKAQQRKSYELSGKHNELEAWQNDNTGSVFAVQIQSGGLGIDLTRAHYCVYYSIGFSLGDFQQSQARIHRPGQKENVTYIKLIAQHTVDEDVYSAIKQKKNVIDAVLAVIKDENIRTTSDEELDDEESDDDKKIQTDAVNAMLNGEKHYAR